jgi:hypothetical protein
MTPLAVSTWLELGVIGWTVGAVIVCSGLPLTAGVARGHTALGIIAAIIALPIASIPALGWIPGLIFAVVSSTVISMMPVPKRPLLTQAEIEKEMRRARGY